ncbi:hypothetical protein C8A05DRAFT_15102 [Staphylotrichum tortipilum]|uniref:Histone-lysine N-methyltransferase SET9 n=1 Tax=Staphylotrichum tortipilum TaxID=2831512 RepID=A0AAN6RTJ6_9PEZI|nr:hypothetical protein C8A05DRAFT_15102 [Staphylotrichum longicolle]
MKPQEVDSGPAGRKKAQQLTIGQLAAYDDILTDALVDHVYYWTTIPKNRPSYHPSRGVREEEITKIIQTHLIVVPDLDVAEAKLLATDGLKKFINGLKTPKEKEDFKGHLRRYMSIYLPDCPFEVNATNRYTIGSYEASVTARRPIRRSETIKYLAGIQVTVTPEEEAQLALRKKDFSLVVSSRSKLTSLFMGPARFANHDCEANARLVTRGQAGIEIIACRDIKLGEEVTVSYSESYFGEDNCDCLCQTCETRLANGWKPADDDDTARIRKSVEEALGASQGYSLRRRRRDESTSASGSRTSSVRPRVFKTQRSQTSQHERPSTAPSVEPDQPAQKRKIHNANLSSPPATPAKRFKTTAIKPGSSIAMTINARPSRDSSETDIEGSNFPQSSSAPGDSTDNTTTHTAATSPDPQKPEPVLLSPDLSPIKQTLGGTKDMAPAAKSGTQALPGPTLPAPTTVPVAENRSVPHQVGRIFYEWGGEAGEYDTDPEDDTVMLLDVCKTVVTADVGVHPTLDTAGVTTTPPKPTVKAAIYPTKKARGAGRKPPVRKPRDPDESPAAPSRHRRTPGDYTLTPLLLSQPETAWIYCTNCSTAFVQRDAYYTRANCFRCERHSKLYGYVWPKTAPAGKGDKEERVLDHRMVNRFLHPKDEAKARGRKHWRDKLGEGKEGNADEEDGEAKPAGGRGRARVRGDGPGSSKGTGGQEADTGSLRRSGRARRASAKALATD